MFIISSSHDAIKRIEDFLRIKGQGTLAQRKSYLIALSQRGNKLNELKIRDIVNTITGSECIVSFFAANEPNNPTPGYGLLKIQVLSPDNSKDYKYDDVARSIKPLAPAHIKLDVIRFFATWDDILENFSDWNAVASMPDWQIIRDYIPPS